MISRKGWSTDTSHVRFHSEDSSVASNTFSQEMESERCLHVIVLSLLEDFRRFEHDQFCFTSDKRSDCEKCMGVSQAENKQNTASLCVLDDVAQDVTCVRGSSSFLCR